MADRLRSLTERYTAAWCSQDAARVAACYEPDGSLTIKDGAPSVGRAEITAAAQGFMTAYEEWRIGDDGLIDSASLNTVLRRARKGGL